jgi:hypothetical protein
MARARSSGGRAKGQQEEMLALNLAQHQGTGDAIEHDLRGCAAASLLQPRVPGGADMRTLGDLLPAKPGRAPPFGRQPEGGRIEFLAAIAQVAAQHVGSVDGSGAERSAHPVSGYTRMTSRLLRNAFCADDAPH